MAFVRGEEGRQEFRCSGERETSACDSCSGLLFVSVLCALTLPPGAEPGGLRQS